MWKFRKYFMAATICLLFSVNAFAQQSQYETTTVDGKKFYVYNVNAAEGFYSLTRQFNVTQQEIEKYNPEAKAGLKKGQRLLIPVSGNQKYPESNTNEYFIHTVQPGETLSSLSRTYNVSINDIKAMNPELADYLVIGHEMKIPQPKSLYINESQYTYHTIEPKETLFSVAKKYGVSMQNIIDENIGLNENSFSVGKIIRIQNQQPVAQGVSAQVQASAGVQMSRYKVQKKETLYSISRKFDITLTSLLEANPGITRVKAGDFINIPGIIEQKDSIAEGSVETIQQMHDILGEATEIRKDGNISVALLLPFQLYTSNVNTALQSRYVEFYEGFLLAVDSLKKQGINFDIFVYDTDSKSITDILAKPEMAKVDLIIGPANNKQIGEVAKFADQHQINVVNPFTFDSDAAENNPHLFQINTPNSYLYAESAVEFTKLFKDNTIVFLKEENTDTDKKDFIDYLRHELTRQNIGYQDYQFADTDQISIADSILNLNGPVVFVPLSASKSTLSKILPGLHMIQRNNPAIQTSLFGYPEWQTYTNDFMDYFYELNTYIYTRIYINPFGQETKDFYEKYKYWFGKELLPVYPRYGILGFDTGMFFLTALDKYGRSFDSHIDMIPAESIQTAMCFRRINNWSGFINRCIYFVNFRPNSTIEKIEVK